MKKLLWIAMYGFINVLFVFKYAAMITNHNLIASLIYLALINIFFAVLHFHRKKLVSEQTSKRMEAIFVGLLAIGLYIVMKQLDPVMIEVGRYPALYQWIEKFLGGEFPYKAESKPSGLPFLFITAIPFYLVGELGLLHIVAFITFSAILLLIQYQKPARDIPRLLLLVVSPVFLYELIVRSDLFSNMILIIIYTIILERVMRKPVTSLTIFLLGVTGGFVLCTRVIVLLIFLPIMGLFIRTTGKRSIWLIIGNILGVLVMTLPFLYWDGAYFLVEGPFAIQISYASPWTLLPIVLLTLVLTFRVKCIPDIFSSATIILFLAVFLPFLYNLSLMGWDRVMFSDRFDISYFAFCLPFHILSFNLQE
jgi:hypothetical protein